MYVNVQSPDRSRSKGKCRGGTKCGYARRKCITCDVIRRRIAYRFGASSRPTSRSIERVSAEDEAAARQIIARYTDKTFSYTDATSWAVMTRLRIRTAFAFDPHFRQYGFNSCPEFV